MSTEGGTRAVVAAAAANGFIALTKLGAYMLTGASSMLAEAIHSVADTGNEVLLLVGGRNARRQADEKHPFGYGRARYLAGFLVSVTLFSVGGLFALYEAVEKLQGLGDPGHRAGSILESQWWWVSIAVLLIAIVAESLSLRTALREVDKERGHQSYGSFVRTAKSPELPVIMLEDIAALTGLSFALLGIVLTLLTGNLIFDIIGTAMIGVLLVVVAVILAVETRSLLLGESASPQDNFKIEQALGGAPGVQRIIHLKTVHVGPEDILLVAKIGVDGATTAADVARVIDAAEDAVRAAVPFVTSSFIEPDIYDENYVPRRGPRPETEPES